MKWWSVMVVAVGVWMASGFARAEEKEARFQSVSPDTGGLRLISSPDKPSSIVLYLGQPAATPAPSTDYYERAALRFTPVVAHAGRNSSVLRIEYLDYNIGPIVVHAGKTPAKPLAGHIALGTERIRHALFQVGTLEKNAEIRIMGLSAVTEVVLKPKLEDGELEKVKAESPGYIPPRLELKRPMQLVMQVGADAPSLDQLPEALATMSEMCPLAASLGFNGVESYVKWNFVEREKGTFDWSFYDAIVAKAKEYNLKWFPLLIVGSAYTLPKWYHDSPENVGFTCLEHGKSNNIQSIFVENQSPYVKAFLNAFGRHYGPTGELLGVRLGPSGNFGESQYPAGGNWGYDGKEEHIHIGWWAGDAYAAPHFREFLKKRYATIETLNAAWDERHTSFDDIACIYPDFIESPRHRKDFVDWYMWAMSDWCERWGVWAREAMPETDIYQSAGGWGFVESGTDFTDQTKSMTKIKGGVRATNETDSYVQNFQVTRMMSSAARFYGVPFGSEPAGFNSGRGIASRIFNLLVNDGQHLFFYNGNFFSNDQAVYLWLELAPLLDQRAKPIIDVAVVYPDSLSMLDDGVFRNLYASSFYQRVAPLRSHLDFDYCSERMILDGALPRYKALVLLWNNVIEDAALSAIDRWVRDGGTVILPLWDRLPLQTVEGDTAIMKRWQSGDTGAGKVVIFREDREPPSRYADRIKDILLTMDNLHPLTKVMLRIEKPAEVYVSALETGKLAILNYRDEASTVKIPGKMPEDIVPYRIAIVPMAE